MAETVLAVSNLHAWYGESHVLHGVDLSVHKGEVVTLLGRNGAGRTSTLNSVLGLVGRRAGSIVSDFVGILGGWIVARFQLQVASGLYWSSVSQALFMADLQQGLLKPFVFVFLIVTIGCHVGLRRTGGTQGVGRATTISVVAGSVAVIAMDFFLTQVLVTFLYS